MISTPSTSGLSAHDSAALVPCSRQVPADLEEAAVVDDLRGEGHVIARNVDDCCERVA